MLILKQGDKGLYTKINGKVYFPDRNSNLKEGVVTDSKVTVEKEKYGFLTGKNVNISNLSDTQIADVIIEKITEFGCDCLKYITFTNKNDSYDYLIFSNGKNVSVGVINGEVVSLSEDTVDFRWILDSSIKTESLFGLYLKDGSSKYLESIFDKMECDDIETKHMEHIFAKVVKCDTMCRKLQKVVIVKDLIFYTKFVVYKGVLVSFNTSCYDAMKIGAKPITDFLTDSIYIKYVGSREYTLHPFEVEIPVICDAIRNDIVTTETYKGIKYAWIKKSELSKFLELDEEYKLAVIEYLKLIKEDVLRNIEYLAKKGAKLEMICELGYSNRINVKSM